ncbi:hypothetical protein GCM10022215_42630 [Nocardioides fonticola]|uniref:C2H2-type domain-containing protein n=1 Tax=Nocardioides fonticola TaxID=450363 RepID=A0ABP7Y2L2_9ACTN
MLSPVLGHPDAVSDVGIGGPWIAALIFVEFRPIPIDKSVTNRTDTIRFWPFCARPCDEYIQILSTTCRHPRIHRTRDPEMRIVINRVNALGLHEVNGFIVAIDRPGPAPGAGIISRRYMAAYPIHQDF